MEMLIDLKRRERMSDMIWNTIYITYSISTLLGVGMIFYTIIKIGSTL